MAAAWGFLGALIVFAASFALHIVGGATDQDWLFAIAVALIYLSAAGFPAIAWLFAGAPAGGRIFVLLGGIVGSVLTISALRAASDRTFEWWQVPLGIALVALTSVAIVGLTRILYRPSASSVAAGVSNRGT